MRGRPKIPRLITELPKIRVFKPEVSCGEVVLTFEELEAIRLVDYLDYTQEEASKLMGISRRVLWNLLTSARKKIADALIHGKTIRIEGGTFELRTCERCIGPKRHCRGWRL
ncbi:protein of unknown function DUF134 [Methanocaldococcus infernus ME]|uniref:UPF0251 protein Metin_0848 n=1 Tax=Methanocaldococcus infernus (strain DSM 11812 / JCM 15783 / ME) TaxID=573063 RepID=D5VSF9_METIM|nr:protein of unknown function DUF134 [Methanocaldococcus infernus ME]